MIWLKRTLAILLILLWSAPWLISASILTYGFYILKPPFSPEEAEILNSLILKTVFIVIGLVTFSTMVFLVLLHTIPAISSDEKGMWLKRFTFSYITAIPRFWYKYIWDAGVS